jgi:hypothetical protein
VAVRPRFPDALAILCGNPSEISLPHPVSVAMRRDRIVWAANKDQCKNNGWQTFTNPTFKNQGDCIQFVNAGK